MLRPCSSSARHLKFPFTTGHLKGGYDLSGVIFDYTIVRKLVEMGEFILEIICSLLYGFFFIINNDFR